MHILLIHQAFADLDDPGGTRHYELAQRLVQRGHRITIIASPVSYLTGKTASPKIAWKETYSPEPGINVIRAYTYPALHRSFFHRVLAFISFMFSSFWIGLTQKDVDLVWGTSPPIFQGWTAWLLARLKRIKFLFEVRDLWPDFAIAVGVLRSPFLKALSHWLERFLYKHADQIIVNSPGYIDHISQRGGKLITLIPNGADPEMFQVDDKGISFRKKYSLSNKFIALYAGAHGMSNDLMIVLEAAKLLELNREILFILIGDGKEKAMLQTRAADMGLSNVLFFPPVAKRDMAEALAAADCCIAILKPIEMYKTTYPNKVFDYMAAGKPVVLAIDGVIRKLVEEAQAGIFCPPGNPSELSKTILELSNDPKAVQKMGIAGKTYVSEHYHRTSLANRLADLVEDMGRNECQKQ
ncbi:MAG TPA: glycosyltransferase family 4 protein [Longilinea sp.]|nr:glycosyltransferase family 4 protein [Longilinea sp.]